MRRMSLNDIYEEKISLEKKEKEIKNKKAEIEAEVAYFGDMATFVFKQLYSFLEDNGMEAEDILNLQKSEEFSAEFVDESDSIVNLKIHIDEDRLAKFDKIPFNSEINGNKIYYNIMRILGSSVLTYCSESDQAKILIDRIKDDQDNTINWEFANLLFNAYIYDENMHPIGKFCIPGFH